MRRGYLFGPRIPGNRISLIHVDDLVRAILQWLQAKQAEGAFELDDGATQGYTWEDITAIAYDTWQRPVTHIRVPVTLLRGIAHANLLLARVFRYRAMLTPGKVNEITHENWVCDNTPLTKCLGMETGN